MSMSLGGADEYNSEINVTPMVDVMLVLLIIFMLVTPLLQQGVSVTLPSGMISPEEDKEIVKDTSVVISIPDNSNFYIGTQRFPLEDLGKQIQTKMQGKAGAERIVYIKADDAKVDYGTVVKAIDEIRKQDIDKVGLVADKKKTAGQPQS